MKIQKSVKFVIKNSKIKMKIKFTIKLGTTAIIQENIEVLQHSICNLRCNVPNEIPIVHQNGCNYDYHFIIKELAGNLINNLFV